ncbi:MAG: trigger factor [Nitrospirales bacterium]|nr:trigger factor [Nitrospirales bacterium]
MLKAVEDISGTKKRLIIEIPAESIESEIKKGLLEAQKRVRIPGFRPGKAPLGMIEKQFGKEIEADVLERVIPDHYAKALREANIVPVTPPVMEEALDYQRNTPFSMTVSVEIRPSVENLSYEGISVKDVPVEVLESDVEMTLTKIVEDRATYEPSEDQIQDGDLVTVDYTTSGGDESEATDSVFKIGSGPYPKEFFDAFIGKQKEDEFSCEVSFPADSASAFAGKDVKFQVKVKDSKRRSIPSVDDELAKEMGFDDLEALKKEIWNNIEAAKKQNADMTKQKEILETLLSSHDFELPEGLVSAELQGLVAQTQAVSGAENSDDEAMRSELRPQAERSVKASILLALIGEKEDIGVTEDDLKAEVIRMAQSYYVSPQHVVDYYMKHDGSLERLRKGVFETKVLNLLLGKAKVEIGG